jgi:hypothetical protein
VNEPVYVQIPLPDFCDAEFRAMAICLYAFKGEGHPFGDELTPEAKARIATYLAQRFPSKPEVKQP